MNVVILAGAGLSKPAGVPLASDLLGLVHEKLGARDVELFEKVLGRVESGVAPGDRGPILEDIIDSLELFRISDRLGIGPWVSPPPGVSHVAHEATKLRDRLAELASTELGPTAPIDYLVPIAEFAKSQRLPIVTLNYDQLVETLGSERGVEVHRGLRPEGDAEMFDYYSDNVSFDIDSGVELIKLHGSVDWIEYDVSFSATRGMHKLIYTGGDERFLDSHYHDWTSRRRPMILGGTTKLRHDGMFPGLWARANEVTSDADRLVIAGYSMCDDHVNELIRRFIWHRRGPEHPDIVVLELESRLAQWYADRERTGRIFPNDFEELFYAGDVSHASLEHALTCPRSELRPLEEVLRAQT